MRELEELPPPLPVVGLSKLARRILGLVAYFVAGGSAGLEVGLWELSYKYRRSLNTVRRARDELVRKGWLVVTPQYIPAEETKLGGRYVTANGPFRSWRTEDPDDPDAHDQSQARNLYTLGSLAVAAGFAERCGQLGEDTSGTPVEQATFSASSSGSGSDSGSGSPESPDRPCGDVDNPTGEPEIEGSASSPRSTFSPSAHDGDSLLEAAHFDGVAPLVADARGDVDQLGDGDGSEAVMEGAPRRGLWSKLARILAGGAS